MQTLSFRFVYVFAGLLVLMGCNKSDTSQTPSSQSLRIVAGSENKTLQPLFDRFTQESGVALQMDYRGSVDIMLSLQSGSKDFDAVMPASSLWITLGDKQRRVQDTQSIYWSPVALGVKRSVAQKLGWTGKPVRVEDILKASEAGRLNYMATSATQSNSGAAAYLGNLYAFAGNPQVLTSQDLNKPNLRDKIRRLYSAINRSAGSSGFLKDLFLQKYDLYDGLVNYESVLIETNQALLAQGKEPLYLIYPADGLALADAPLGFVESGNAEKRAAFKKLQDFLLSEPIQKELLALGRRTGPVGAEIPQANAAIFNPEWGINLSQFLNQIRYPKPEVIQEALNLYQSAFRKPSFTVYCLDFSGSMEGAGEEGLKTAMRMVLDQERAKTSMLQATPKDVTLVIPFNHGAMAEWRVNGNAPAEYQALLQKVVTLTPTGGTDIFSPTLRAYQIIQQAKALENHFPAIILMSDGVSNNGRTLQDFKQFHASLQGQSEVPVYGILFGDASEAQMGEVAKITGGRIFDGKNDLAKAFREAKGYN